jgi:hypothetical protein
MNRTKLPHYHIRWSGKVLDWEPFITLEEAEASAKQLTRLGETYTIEEYDGACARCREAMKAKMPPSSSHEASA